MKKEVVWIYGTSASGKGTFIKKMMSGESPEVVGKLGWKNKTIAASGESLRHIGQFYADPVIQLRERILTEVPSLIKNHEVVLVKGQDVDFKTERPQRLKELLPFATHRIIFISTALDELAERLVAKPWWDTRHNPIKWAQDEIRDQTQRMKKVADQFDIIALNGSKNQNYKATQALWMTN